jgi:general secretion pathway protein D
VSTQFQYIDVGVNVDMTPTVHYDHDVTLKMTVEVSTESGSVTISGITEPIIASNKDDTVIRLKEGESTILASIVTKSIAKSVSGTPFLGEIPILKYLFASTSTQDNNDEVVFLITPHIVREQVLTALNTRPIDTGTVNEIELRHAPDMMPAAAAASVQPAGYTAPQRSRDNVLAAAGQVQQTSNALLQAPADQADSSLNQAGPSPQGPPVMFSFSPSEGNHAVGSTFQVQLRAAGGHDLSMIPLQLQYDPAKLQLVDVTAGDLLSRDGQTVAMAHRDDGAGGVTVSLSRPPNAVGVTGDGSVCVLTFKALASGDAPLALKRVGAKNSQQASLPAVSAPAMLHLK